MMKEEREQMIIIPSILGKICVCHKKMQKKTCLLPKFGLIAWQRCTRLSIFFVQNTKLENNEYTALLYQYFGSGTHYYYYYYYCYCINIMVSGTYYCYCYCYCYCINIMVSATQYYYCYCINTMVSGTHLPTSPSRSLQYAQ